MGRQKAIQALEIYREHEKFRNHLENMKPESETAEAPDKEESKSDKSESDEDFLTVAVIEEEKQ